MTGRDFFLLFVAFGGFVIAPALLIWGLSYFTRGPRDESKGPGVRPTAKPTPAQRDDEGREPAQSAKAEFLVPFRAEVRAKAAERTMRLFEEANRHMAAKTR